MKRCKRCKVEKPIEEFAKWYNGAMCHPCALSYCTERKKFRKMFPHLVRRHKKKNPKSSERDLQYKEKDRRKHPTRQLFHAVKNRAKKKGIPFTLDRVEMQKRLDKGVCELTGIPFILPDGKSGSYAKHWRQPSYDQIIPGEGYTPENTRIVLWGFNAMANSWGIEPILRVADAIRSRAQAPQHIDSFCVGA